jgi:Domain of unknown function (DUF6754)/Putative Ig domain
VSGLWVFAAGLPLANLPPVVRASYAMYVLAALLLLPALLFIFLAKRGKELYIRRIPGIDAIEEAIGRATELGRPMMFTTGLTRVNALLYALLGILRYIAGKSAAYGCRLIVPQCDYEVMPICEETVREAYRAAGRLDAFNPRDIRFLSTDQFAFASGYMGIAHREKAASCFLFGAFAAESLILAEAGQQVGAMQVAGTASNTQVPFFLTSCDYTIIGEEVYAAGAYLSREPAQLGSVRGQDFSKLIILAVILLGVISATWMTVARRDTLEAKKLNNPFSRMLYAKPGQRRVLARMELKDSYQPDAAPKMVDIEDRLASARRKFGYNARLVRGEIGGTAKAMGALEKSLEELLDRFPAGDGRAEAAKVAAGLGGISERAGQVRGELAEFLKKKLPEIEKVYIEKGRERAAEFYLPELEKLDYWLSLQKVTPVRCVALVKHARSVLENSASRPAAIERAVRRAREACYAAHFTAVRADFRAAELAAERAEPGFALKTPAVLDAKLRKDLEAKVEKAVSDRRAALVKNKKVADGKELEAFRLRKWQALFRPHSSMLKLNGTESVSGRGSPLPLSYAWKVLSLPGLKGVAAMRRGIIPVALPGPGRYRVELTVSERLPRKNMILGVDGAVPSKVEHLTITTGCKLGLTWRLAKNAVPEGCKVTYETKGRGLDLNETREVSAYGHQKPVELSFEEPGEYVTTLVAEFDLKPVKDEAAERRRRAAAAAKAVPEVASARRRVAIELTAIIESFNRINGRLGIMETAAKRYKERLFEYDKEILKKKPDLAKRHAKLSDENWPDRKIVGELHKYVKDLRRWLTESSIFVARVRAQADILGTGKMDLPAAKKTGKEPQKGGEKKPEKPVAPKPAGAKKSAGLRITSHPEKYVTEGQGLSYKITAAGKAPITFRVENLPKGLSFDGKNAISGKLRSAGPHAITMVAGDAEGKEVRVALTVGWSRPGGWKRYRIYWHVVEPLKDSVSRDILVTEAPKRPRAPWQAVPAKPEKSKPKEKIARGGE